MRGFFLLALLLLSIKLLCDLNDLVSFEDVINFDVVVALDRNTTLRVDLHFFDIVFETLQ